jgi:hypothetical protein
MTTVKLRAPTDSGSVSIGGREIKIEDGQIEVTQEQAAVLRESHGFVDPGADPKTTGSGDGVVIPRADFFAGLKQLGIVLADGIPADKLVEAFREGCARQDERLKFELGAAEKRHADEVTAAEKRGEDKAIAALSNAEGAALSDLKKAAAPPDQAVKQAAATTEAAKGA